MVAKRTDGFRCEVNGDVLDVFIYDDIFSGAAREVAVALGSVKRSAPINVYINSDGGSVFESFAIFNQFRRAEGHVTVHVDGVAASGASVIAMSGDEIHIASNAFMMIHNASGLVLGDAEDMRFVADKLDRLSGSVEAIYASRTGNSREQLAEWMAGETWFDAEEAVEHGFADSVVEEKEVANKFDWSVFNNTPSALMPRAGKPKQPRRAYSRQAVETIIAGLPEIFGDLPSGVAGKPEGGATLPDHKETQMAGKETTFTEVEVKAKLTEAQVKWDGEAKVERAKAITEAVNKAVAEAQVTAKAEMETAITEAVNKATEATDKTIREGIKEVLARCETAGIALTDARSMIDSDLSLEDAKDAVIKALVKQRDAVGGDPKDPGEKKEDPKAKYVAEFKAADGQQGVGVTEEEYVESRMRTEAGGTFD